VSRRLTRGLLRGLAHRLARCRRRAARRTVLAAGAAVAGALACADPVVGPDPGAEPAAVFDAAWQAFDRHFAFFGDKQLDWDLAYADHRPRVPAAGGTAAAERQLFDAVCALVRATGSLHSTLVAPTVGGASGTCAPDLGQRGTFFDPRLVRGRYVRSFGATASTRIGFGPLPPWATIEASTRRDGGTIGYVAIPSFAGAGWGGEIDDAVATLEARSRAEAPSAPGLGALIIDVRGNGGGDEATARAVAARFVDQERVYALRRFRDGPARGALGPPAEARVAPAGRRFAGRVVVLTDRGTASAAEDFVLMMRVVPGAVVVGDTTSGTASQPLPRQLPNGWWLRVPASMELTPDGAFVVEGRGLPPDVAAPSAPADVERDLDAPLSAAVALLTGFRAL